MKDCCVRCEIQIAFFFNFLIFLFNTFYCSILDYIFFRFVFGIWDSIENSNTFCFLFSSLDFILFQFHTIWMFNFIVAWLFSLVEFISWLLFFFFSIANYYSWVVKDWDFFDKKDINGNERLGFFFQKKYWWKTSSKKDLLRRVYGIATYLLRIIATS